MSVKTTYSCSSLRKRFPDNLSKIPIYASKLTVSTLGKKSTRITPRASQTQLTFLPLFFFVLMTSFHCLFYSGLTLSLLCSSVTSLGIPGGKHASEYPRDSLMTWTLPYLTLSSDANSSIFMQWSALIKASAFSCWPGWRKLMGGMSAELKSPNIVGLLNSGLDRGPISAQCCNLRLYLRIQFSVFCEGVQDFLLQQQRTRLRYFVFDGLPWTVQPFSSHLISEKHKNQEGIKLKYVPNYK